MSAAAADLNLLFAVLALQNELVGKDDLLAAMNAWGLEKHRALGDILVERGALLPEDRQLLDGLIERQLKRHGSAEKSLAARRDKVIADLLSCSRPPSGSQCR